MKPRKWKESNKSAEEIVKKLRRREKAVLLYGNGFWESNGLAKHGIPSFTMHDGPCGLRIPVSGADGESKKATCFPSPAMLACTWNRDLAKVFGEALAKEAIANDTDVILAPGVNIKRNPLCGRNFEYLSEDPYVAGKMSASIISGIQSKGVGACIKHFACNSQETARFVNDSQVDERALREIYLKPFEIAIHDSHPWMVMCAYNKINGKQAADHSYLLTQILKGEWGYDGVVVSDWGAANDPIRNHAAGLDLEMPCFEHRAHALSKAVRQGIIPEEQFNDSARRVASLALRTLSRPSVANIRYEDQRNIALRIAEEGIVLAKNAKGTLPLKNYEDCCVIGALAKHFPIQGGGSSKVEPMLRSSLLEEMERFAFASSESIPYAPGYSLQGELLPADEEKLVIDACELAAKHKKVIFVVGTRPGEESEEYDRESMSLPANQLNLFEQVSEINQNIILVVLSGSPVELPMAEECKAILLSYFGGEMGAKALHHILIGRVNPSGKLAESWPDSYSSVPSSRFYPGNTVPSAYKESIYVGYRYYQSASVPVLFPFGHGLSYSRMVYKDLNLSDETLLKDQKLEATFTIHNYSRLQAKETVQVYVSRHYMAVFKPTRELKEFVKVTLEPNETRTIKISLNYADFAHFDIASGQYLVEEGKYDIQIGSSSEATPLRKTVEVLSGIRFKNEKQRLPSYYYFNNKSLFVPSDSEYEYLLGHRIKHQRPKRDEHYTFDSTLKEFSKTRVGKRIAKELENRIDPNLHPRFKKLLYENQLRMPVRVLSMGGLKEKKIVAILSLANKRFVKAFFDLMFGTRK